MKSSVVYISRAKNAYSGDTVLVIFSFLLVGISLVMVYSTTGVLSQETHGDPFFFVRHQLVYAGIGLVFFFVASIIKLEVIKKLSPLCLPIGIILLGLTFVPGLKEDAGGASRWIQLGPLRLQPGEFVKVLVLIFISGYYSRHEEKIQDLLGGLIKPLFFAAIFSVMFLLQPDFGSASVIFAVVLCMALAVGARIIFIFCGGLIFSALAALLVIVSPYRMSRVVSFLSPWEDPAGKGYQLIQSLIAIGSGHVSGVGLGGSQQKLFFLPAAHTDFIFSVIGEELGFLGCLGILALFIFFLWRGFKISGLHANDTFAFSLSVGLTLIIVLPALLNIGVTTGMLPTKGLVLPLIGYGGSSLIASLLSVGLLFGLSKNPTKVD